MRPALCVRIKRRDGKILRTTSHDVDIVVTDPDVAGTYRTAAALAPSEMQFRASLAVDGLDVAGILDESTGIPERDVAAGIYDMARVTIFEVDWSDPSVADGKLYGVLGNKRRTEEGRLQMEIRTLAQLLNQDQGDVYTMRCRAELGSGEETPILRRCGVDMTPFTFDEVVTAVVSRTAFFVAGLSQDAGYFSRGLVEFLSGDNAGAVREIRLHEAGGVMLLYDPLPYDVAAGDQVRVKAGCNKMRDGDCSNKFDNVINFKGEPDIPGANYMARSSTKPPTSSPGGQSLLGSVVQFVATAIGAYFGPWGAFIGSMIGAALAPVSGGRAVGPKADDLRVTSSTAGKRIPYIAGRYFSDGNIIWAKEIIEVVTTRRVGKSLFSSGTKVTEYTYFFTGAISLCEGPITGILRIWAYGKLIYDRRPLDEREAEFAERFESVLTGVEASTSQGAFATHYTQLVHSLNADLERYMTVHIGTEDQEPDPTMAEAAAADSDSAGTPAYRGQAYVVFNQLPLDQFGYGARVPQLRFEICRPLAAVETGDSDDNDNVGDDVLVAA